MALPYWRLSGFYFFYFATLGCFLPFWSLYLSAAGFDALTIGELSALLLGTKIIAPNIWGWIADHTGRSLRIIRIAAFFAALFFTGFLFISGYSAFALVTLLFSFFWNATLPQFEVVTLGHIQAVPQRYAHIRLWGSVGFIVAVLGIGRLLDYTDIVILPSIILGLLTANWLVAVVTPEASLIDTKRDSGGVGQIIKCPEVIAFMIVCLLLQVAHSAYYVFYSVYLKQYQYSATLTGGLWALGVAVEIVLFLAMQMVLKRVSLRRILLVSILLSILRWLLIARFPENFWIIVGAQLLHAATFGAVHVVAMYLLQHYFGPEHQGKGQALYTSISFGLGGMLGGYASGYCWTALGAQSVFWLAAGCCLIAWIVAGVWVGRENGNKLQALG